MPMYSPIKSILVLLFAFVFLSACGGGGGSSTPTVAAPVITSPVGGGFVVADSVTSGAVGKLDITGTVTGIVLNDRDTGAVSTVFEAADDGTIRFRSAAGRLEDGALSAVDAIKTVHNLTAVVSNGSAQSSVNFTINIASAPVVTGFSGSVDENANVDSEVGTIVIDDQGFDISSVVLSGTGSDNFAVSNAGLITVVATTGFDQEAADAVSVFNLTAIATNAGGDSQAATVTIDVTDVADTQPSITAADGGYKVLIGKPANTLVGTLEIDNGGSKIQTATLSGVDASFFILSNSGELKVSVAGATALVSAVAGDVYNLTAQVTNANQLNAESDSIDFTVTATGKVSFSSTDKPKLMAIGDSITSGHGEDRTRAESQATFDAAKADLEQAEADLVAAQAADPQVPADIESAKTARDEAQAAFDQAEFILFVRTQRFSYRKALDETYNADDNSFDFEYVGPQAGPISSDGLISYLVNDKHAAYSGSTVDQLRDKTEIQSSLAAEKPSFALIHAGTNDVSFNNGDPIAQTVEEMKGLVAEIRKNNDEAVILIAKIIPIDSDNKVFFDFSGENLTDTAVINNQFVAGYNDALQAMVNADNHPTSEMRIVDHYSSFLSGGEVNKTLYIGDGVHPSEAGDDVIAKNWYCAMVEFYSDTTGGEACTN